jgi:hypothetical protein
VTGGAPCARAAVAGVGGQQRLQHLPAQLQHRRADRPLGRLQAGPAGQRRGHRCGERGYLGGGLRREPRRELVAEPPYLYPAASASVRVWALLQVS